MSTRKPEGHQQNLLQQVKQSLSPATAETAKLQPNYSTHQIITVNSMVIGKDSSMGHGKGSPKFHAMIPTYAVGRWVVVVVVVGLVCAGFSAESQMLM